MKNNHMVTAVKALKRQLSKYEIQRDRFESEENSARSSKEFFSQEIAKLDKQISEIEEALGSSAGLKVA